MSAALLAPLGLAALAALLVPLLIHLARRDRQRPIDFAALRWLEPRPKPHRRPHLDERALLVARLLLLTLLALALARPALLGGRGAGTWLLVAPGADPAAARAQAPKGAQARWLAPGFPNLGQSAPEEAASISSLLRELDADLPRGARLIVAVPAALQGVDAERPRLSRDVDWRVQPQTAPPAPPRPPSSPTSAHAGPQAPTPDQAADQAAVQTLVLRAAPELEAGARYVKAAAEAWSPSATAAAPDAGPLSAPLPNAARAIAWLAPGPLPVAVRDRVAGGAVVLLPVEATVDGLGPATPLWRDAEGRVLAEGGGLGRGRWRRFTRPLTSEAMPEVLQPDFPARLAALLSNPPPPPALVEARAYHPLVGAAAGSPSPQDLTPIMALMVAALFAVERWLATRPQRADTP